MPIYTYTTLDDSSQGATTTDAWGINNSGQIVGYYQNATGVHGFLYSGGTYTTLNDPLGTAGTWAGRRANSPAAAGDHDLGASATGR